MGTSRRHSKILSPRRFLEQWRLVIGILSLASLVKGQEKYPCPSNKEYFYPCVCEKGGSVGIFMKCENTNLASMAVGLANVRVPIEELVLFRCNIEKLFGDVFKTVQIKVRRFFYVSI